MRNYQILFLKFYPIVTTIKLNVFLIFEDSIKLIKIVQRNSIFVFNVLFIRFYKECRVKIFFILILFCPEVKKTHSFSQISKLYSSHFIHSSHKSFYTVSHLITPSLK